jgi:hypothetical protein
VYQFAVTTLRTDVQLIVRDWSLRDTVTGLELQLPPVKNLWDTIHGAEILCQAVEELLGPSKKTTLLDIGCGTITYFPYTQC